jgi:hypothetical protein
MESGVDLLMISRLLGHRSFSATLVYLHVRRPHAGLVLPGLLFEPALSSHEFPEETSVYRRLAVEWLARQQGGRSPEGKTAVPVPERDPVT